MIEVTKEKYLQAIKDKDAVLNFKTHEYPYIRDWELRGSGKIIARITDNYTNNITYKYPIVSRYYLPI